MEILPKVKKYLPVFLILILAAFLRLYRIEDYMTFLGDEGRDVLVVYNILHGDLTLLGPTASVGGFFMGPIYYYFMAPFVWLFNYNPVGPAIMVALFGIATVGLVYKVASEFFNTRVACVASFFYAISPLVISYSRSSWNPNLMPFFSLLLMFLLYRAVLRNSKKYLLLVGVFLGILLQLHYVSLFLGFIVLMYTVTQTVRLEFSNKKATDLLQLLKKNLGDLSTIFIGFLIGFSLFLAFEVRHGFPNIRNIVLFIFTSKETGANTHFISVLFESFFRLFSRLLVQFPSLEQVSIPDSLITLDIFITKLTFHVYFLYYATVFLACGSVGLAVYQWYKFRKDKIKFAQYNLLLSWFLIGILLFGFYKKSIYDYYFEFMFPLPFLFTANFILFLVQNKKTWIIGAVIFIWLTIMNVIGTPFRYVPNRQLNQAREIARFVYDKANGTKFNFALVTGGNSDHAYRYFFKLWNNDPVTIENEVIDPKRKTVTDQLLVICETTCAPLGHPLWEIAGFGPAQITNDWNLNIVRVYKLKHVPK